jgi:hypothetical protein
MVVLTAVHHCWVAPLHRVILTAVHHSYTALLHTVIIIMSTNGDTYSRAPVILTVVYIAV